MPRRRRTDRNGRHDTNPPRAIAVSATESTEATALRRTLTWLGFAIVVSLFWLLLAPSQAQAQTTPPTDFSDMRQQLVQWPFDVVEYWTEEDEFNLYQLSRVQESSHQVFQYFDDLKRERGTLGGYMVRGATKQAEPGHYMAVLVDDDGRHFVYITPDGAGSVIKLKATPNTIVSGYFKRALYGYKLGDGARVDASRADNMDE